MILSKEEILNQFVEGTIIIEPFEETLVQENSVDFRLGFDMWEMRQRHRRNLYDPRPDDFEKMDLWEGRFILRPGGFYIGTTYEKIGTRNPYDLIQNPIDEGYMFLVPEVKAKSTLGRQGLTVALCAGHGEIGYKNQWALEIRNVTQSETFLFPKTVIGQVVFHTCSPTRVSYGGSDRYQDGDITKFLPKALKVVE